MDCIESAIPGRSRAIVACLSLAMLSLSSCLVADGNAACGPGQIQVAGEGTQYCRCQPGFVIDDDDVGCKPCGENEESDGLTCSCKAGFTRPLEGGACMESSLGAACMSSAECAGDYSFCVVDGSDGYCSSEGCTSSAQCQPTWYCEQEGGSSVCKKPPDGYRRACEGPDDCAGSAATFCDSFQSHSCLIQGCGKGSPCPGDWSCCEISVLGITLCIEPSGIVNGACPAGGTMVPP